MLLSAAHRNVVLLPVVFLIGVWVGQSRFIDQQFEGQDKPRRTEIRSELERRTSEKLTSGTAEDQQAGDVSRQQLTSIASGLDPSLENSESEPIQALSDMLAPSDESSRGESYSYLVDVAQESTAIEPSPQSIEDDIIRSLEEAGIPTEEISNNVENLMGMILQEDQQTPEAYPSISARNRDVPRDQLIVNQRVTWME